MFLACHHTKGCCCRPDRQRQQHTQRRMCNFWNLLPDRLKKKRWPKPAGSWALPSVCIFPTPSFTSHESIDGIISARTIVQNVHFLPRMRSSARKALVVCVWMRFPLCFCPFAFVAIGKLFEPADNSPTLGILNCSCVCGFFVVLVYVREE